MAPPGTNPFISSFSTCSPVKDSIACAAKVQGTRVTKIEVVAALMERTEES